MEIRPYGRPIDGGHEMIQLEYCPERGLYGFTVYSLIHELVTFCHFPVLTKFEAMDKVAARIHSTDAVNTALVGA